MKVFFTSIFVLFLTVMGCAQEQALLIDGFENPLSGGADGTVDFGAGGGSAVEVNASSEIKHSGNQSIKIVYDAVPGGYMWVARGFGLDAKNTDWLMKPEEIAWEKYQAFSFYLYGSDSKTTIAFDLKDKGNEMWRFLLEDNFQGWKEMILPFAEFFARSDWQPNNAEKNGVLDFPIKSFQFEPRPEAKGTLYFDDVSLLPK